MALRLRRHRPILYGWARTPSNPRNDPLQLIALKVWRRVGARGRQLHPATLLARRPSSAL